LKPYPRSDPLKHRQFIDGRPYKAPEDVMKVKGIKEGTFNKIKDYITVR
jgi:competence protein ComEA